MKKAINLFTLVIGLLSCDSKKEVRLERNSTDGPKVINSSAKTIREEYWPLESETVSIDTVVNSKNSYRIKIHTRSLNDSAALFKVTDEQGEILVHAHNRISEITIIKRDGSIIKSKLTRDLFKGRDELDELRLMYWTSFLRLEKKN